MNGSVTSALTTLHLSVNNHPGVLSHVCGLFAGRAYNLEGVLVTPEASGDTCRMWLVVKDDGRMEQIVKQVRKLHDVLCNANYDFDRSIIESIELVQSHDVLLLQLADVLIGALSYVHRGLHDSPAKQALVAHLAASAQVQA